jgi:Large polyvalent protein associated domain 29
MNQLQTQPTWQEVQNSRKEAAKALQGHYPHLKPVDFDDYASKLTVAAKNIRIELKAAFPGATFSVKVQRFSGGDAINVKYPIGIEERAIRAITGKYKAGSFDGMTDCYNYETSAWNDAFGEAKYISVYLAD